VNCYFDVENIVIDTTKTRRSRGNAMQRARVFHIIIIMYTNKLATNQRNTVAVFRKSEPNNIIVNAIVVSNGTIIVIRMG